MTDALFGEFERSCTFAGLAQCGRRAKRAGDMLRGSMEKELPACRYRISESEMNRASLYYLSTGNAIFRSAAIYVSGRETYALAPELHKWRTPGSAPNLTQKNRPAGVAGCTCPQ